jgi:ADP-heptose:LPS heptosyltransferase
MATDTWRDDRELSQDPPDVRVPIGSLPRFLRKEGGAFPRHTGYLTADAQRVAAWRDRLDALPGRKKVGLSWRGGLATTRRSVRSIELPQWLGLLKNEGVAFVSLQYGEPGGEIEALVREHGVVVHHWPEAIDDYDETAALVTALDIVVSVQTAIVHLAGALGKPVWALIPHVAEWRYGAAGEGMPWYPSVRLFRQARASDWDGVLARVADDLRAWSNTSGG